MDFCWDEGGIQHKTARSSALAGHWSVHIA